MRIKLFDNYNIGYEEISGDEYGNKIGYDSGNGVFFNNFNSYDEDFTENELQKINRIVDNESYHIRPTSIITDNGPTNVKSRIDICAKGTGDTKHPYIDMIDIVKLKDSWFLLQYSDPSDLWGLSGSKLYKCDEFNGLIKLLKELL